MSDYATAVHRVKTERWDLREESKDGVTIIMAGWVMDHACEYVDASAAVAIREVEGGYRLCDAYTAEVWEHHDRDADLDMDEIYDELGDAIRAANNYNDVRGIGPMVIPSDWAVLGREAPAQIGRGEG